MKSVFFPFSRWATLFALSMFLPSCPCSSFADSLATSGPVIVEPLSVPADAAGWGRKYVPVAAETFSTPIRVPARGFSLQPGGQWITDSDGISWVRGSSSGQSDYLSYYGTEPGVVPLTGGREYQLTFTYRIEETPDRGFEALFYSPRAGSKNHWVPGIHIEGKKGKSGTASFRARLFAESDYRAWWNVVHSGRIAIRNIEISDVSTGAVVARDDLGTKGYGPGRELACRGFTPGSEAPGTLALRFPGALRTVPSVLPLKPDTVYIVEFSWRAQKRNTEHPTILGIVSLFSERDETHVRYGKRIDGGDQDEGHYVGGIRTGSAAAPYVLQIALADKVELLISDLRFLRQQPKPRSAGENPGLALSRAPFPRLGNYQNGLPDYIAWDASGRAKGELPLMSTAELDRRLALYDIVVGLAGATTTLDPAACLRLRELNPGIVLLPYVISHEPSRAQWLVDQFSNPLADAEAEFARGFDKGWYLRTSTGALVEDPDFPWFAKANISPDCPRDSVGRDYIDYFTEKTIDLWFRDGTWDGLFMDNLLAQRNPHIKNAFDPRAFDADYNRNGRRDETIPWTHEMTARASLRMLRQLRQRLGDAEMLIGNAGPYPELLLAPYVNGYTFEQFNYPWYGNGGPNGFSEPHWGETFSNYRQMEATVRQPAAIILEAAGPTPQLGAELAGGYHGVTARDIRIQRIALGTALLGNGFYEYDLFHNLDAPSFFDEWLVGPDGASVDNATGKGWLGQALGPAVELSTDQKSIREMPAPRRIGQDAGTVLQMDCGVNRSGASLQYVVELDWQVEATLEQPAYLNFELDGRSFDGASINGLVAGTIGHTRAYLTTPAQHHLVVKVHVTDAGVLAVKNLRITTAHCGVFRRDFQNGVVFVNATNEPRTLSAENVRGPFQRTGLRRIAGKLDPEVNNGKPVQGSLALPAADALVLLADSR